MSRYPGQQDARQTSGQSGLTPHPGIGQEAEQERMRQQGRAIRELFGPLAGRYDVQNRLFSLWRDVAWRKRLTAGVRQQRTGCFLDLAAGTLDVSLMLHRRFPLARILALDLSHPMLSWGRRHKLGASGARRAVIPLTGDARSLPLPEASVDAVTVAFGIRNMVPRSAALAEIRRVLIPGGRLHVLEFAPVTTPLAGPLYHWHLEKVMPVLAGLVSGKAEAFRYLNRTIRDFPAPSAFARELEAAGLAPVAWEPLSCGIANIHRAEKP